ncbi:hypothetical protein [Acinetobacter baumannii]|nr:hypothetical protein [Acinetobacter baumannii]
MSAQILGGLVLVDQAHVYTLEQAKVAWDNARFIDQPIAVHHVRKHIV